MDKVKDMSTTMAGKGSIPSAKPKEKRRSNEKRKEKSRDAARCRRSRETEIFSELATVLPIRREDIDQLDKASIMRLSIAFLKVREMLKLFPKIKILSEDNPKVKNEKKPFDLKNISEDHKLMMQALDGFLMILSSDGDITYVSDNISEFLGISQIDILGQPIWEYSHQCDHEELKEALNMRRINASEYKREKNSNDDHLYTTHRDFFIRLKCTLTSRGRSVNIKSASYKVIHVNGHMIENSSGDRILITIGRPLPHPSNIEIPLGSTTFLTKHSLDMKFTYVDDKMLSLLGYHPEDLLGRSLYGCHHGADSVHLMTIFKNVLSKGQAETCRYRFLGKFGGYSWIVTQATIVYDKQKPQSVVCVNYMISEIENDNEIFSCDQLEAYCENKEKQELSKDQQQEQKENLSSIEIPIKQHKQHLGTLKSENINYNNNNNNININKKESEQISLSPIRKTLNNCSINSIKQNSKVSRPKSVTATVFAQVPLNDRNLNQTTIKNSILTSSASSSLTLPRAQSVTASVFTPISTLSNTSSRLMSGSSSNSSGNNLKSFMPHTKEMNKGYLMFAEDSPDLTLLKEEPDDLTHLAPTPGDACIPLDESTPLFGEMLENLILPDSYGSLLPDDMNSLDSQHSSANNKNIDPFINYRDESSDTSNSPHLLSPLASKSPEVSSLPSLCSPNSVSQDDEFAFMTMNVEDDIDLTMRAPYIPMNEQDDLPLLTEDLMWSAFSDELTLHKDVKDALQMELIKNNNTINNQNNSNSTSGGNSASSLASLLCGNTCSNSLDQSDKMCNQTLTGNKRKKLETIENCSNIVDSIETFGQVFNKNTTNVDCWTMNDLLQLNSSDQSNNQQLNNRLEKQNLMVNTMTIQLPLLTVQNSSNNGNNKNTINRVKSGNMLNNNNYENGDEDGNCNKSVTKILKTLPTNTIIKNNNSDHNNCSGTLTPTINLTCNKRPSNISSSPESKRTKNSNQIEMQSSPQLLQQLMAPTPVRNKTKQSYDKVHTTKWNLQDGESEQNCNLTTSSNSVLKNLLVSGCDGSFPSRPPDIMMEDDTSRDSIGDQTFTVALNEHYSRPLICNTTSTVELLRNCGSNPLIGGVGLLASPLLPTEDSADYNSKSMSKCYPSSLISINNNTELPRNDSGIESGNDVYKSQKEICRTTAKYSIEKPMASFKLEESKQETHDIYMSDGNISENSEKIPSLISSPSTDAQKLSLSFLDADNPFYSSILMDLCSDDYSVDEIMSNDYLQDNEITKVLNELT